MKTLYANASDSLLPKLPAFTYRNNVVYFGTGRRDGVHLCT